MKVAKRVVFKFDPDKSSNPALSSYCGRILWACIKTGHITDQYFDDDVLSVADQLNEKLPDDYEKFKKIISRSNLGKFGKIPLPGDPHGLLVMTLDDEFWYGIYEYIIRRETLEVVVELSNYPAIPDTCPLEKEKP